MISYKQSFCFIFVIFVLFGSLFVLKPQIMLQSKEYRSKSAYVSREGKVSNHFVDESASDLNHSSHSVQETVQKKEYEPVVDWLKVFQFVPNVLRSCSQLFPKKDIFPESLDEKFRAFTSYITENVKLTEGHSGDTVEQRMVFYKLVQAPHVKTVCETGFNAGHSSFMWLESNSEVKVYSFDIGGHGYAKVMEKYLQEAYPGRLLVTWGDSTKTINKFHESNPNVSCDLVLIDGGHSTNVCLKDFYNFKKMAHANTIVILDNYPERRFHFEVNLGNCWERVKRLGEVIEIFNCNFDPMKLKALGFTVARYLRYKDLT